MSDDASVEFVDANGYRTITITPNTINLHSAEDAWRVVLDPSSPGMQVGTEDLNSYILYSQNGITNKIGSSTYYNIGFPNKSGTFALTSDIPSAATVELNSTDRILVGTNTTIKGFEASDGIYALGSNNADGSEDYTLATTDQIPTVPTISTNVVSDKASDVKTSSPKSVYDEVHPAVATSQPAGGFAPNILYNLGTLTGSKTFTLASPSDNTIVNHYYWTFTAGSTAPTITWPSGISWFGGSAPTITAGKHYDISILDNIAICMEV